MNVLSLAPSSGEIVNDLQCDHKGTDGVEQKPQITQAVSRESKECWEQQIILKNNTNQRRKDINEM